VIVALVAVATDDFCVCEVLVTVSTAKVEVTVVVLETCVKLVSPDVVLVIVADALVAVNFAGSVDLVVFDCVRVKVVNTNEAVDEKVGSEIK
jgi:hypothetical protein